MPKNALHVPDSEQAHHLSGHKNRLLKTSHCSWRCELKDCVHANSWRIKWIWRLSTCECLLKDGNTSLSFKNFASIVALTHTHPHLPESLTLFLSQLFPLLASSLQIVHLFLTVLCFVSDRGARRGSACFYFTHSSILFSKPRNTSEIWWHQLMSLDQPINWLGIISYRPWSLERWSRAWTKIKRISYAFFLSDEWLLHDLIYQCYSNVPKRVGREMEVNGKTASDYRAGNSTRKSHRSGCEWIKSFLLLFLQTQE